jgi:hypothetical protein
MPEISNNMIIILRINIFNQSFPTSHASSAASLKDQLPALLEAVTTAFGNLKSSEALNDDTPSTFSLDQYLQNQGLQDLETTFEGEGYDSKSRPEVIRE